FESIYHCRSESMLNTGFSITTATATPSKGFTMPKKPNQAKTATAGNKPKQKLVNGINIQINATKVATLKELRKATGHTQDDLAVALGVGQGTISRIEKRDDMLVSTLQHYIESVG